MDWPWQLGCSKGTIPTPEGFPLREPSMMSCIKTIGTTQEPDTWTYTRIVSQVYPLSNLSMGHQKKCSSNREEMAVI